jgi:hypothetical protein
MKYSLEVRAMLLEKAMGKCKLDSHVRNLEYKKDASTWAERIATRFHVKGGLPVKNTYMHCNTLDMCFFYDISMVPTVTYAGYMQDRAKDTLALPQAFEKAAEVLGTMWEVKVDYDKEIRHDRSQRNT